MKNAAGASTFEVLMFLVTLAALIVATGALVANWLSVPGFPYNPFRSVRPTTSQGTDTGTHIPVEPARSTQTSSTSHRTKKTSHESAPAHEFVSRAAAPPVKEAQLIVPEPAPAPSAVERTPTVVPTPVPRAAVIEREPTGADGFYRGTLVDCHEESNVPGSAAKLCIDLGGKTISATMDSHLYVLVGGWNKRIPLYTGDVVRFEVRHGQLTSAELLSDTHGR